jgi:DNA polymerase elongation subunit (family B)
VKDLSPVGIFRYSDYKQRFVIAGVSILDYLALYKKFNFSEEASYRLDSICKKELGKGKIEFEGTLQQLYENNIEKFIEYNINDVELVVELDHKKKFFDLATGISHKGRTPYEDIFYSSKYLEGAILCDLKRKNLVAPNKPARTLDNKTFIGAFVKDPKPGFYEWVFDLDLTSLYPSIIMSLNISPETKIGKILDWNELDFETRKDRKWRLLHLLTNDIIEPDTKDLVKMLSETGYHISSNGIIYIDKAKQLGVIPTILSKWFDERVKYKNLMKKHGKDDNKEQYDFYDKLQTIQKVLLNSLYGVLGLPIFRFYDLDNAAAVTTTGQAIIKYSEVKGNEFYFNTLNQRKDYCIYIDTDSLFFSATPLLNHFHPNVDYSDEKVLVNHISEIVSKVQTYINDSYTAFAKDVLFIQGKHRFEIKQELICLSGIWTAKKRYALYVVNREGIFVDKLDVKGLDIVRSSFPPAFKGFMTNILISILKKIPQKDIDKSILDLEDSINSISLMDISKNTSINDIVKYQADERQSAYYSDGIFSEIKKGTPAHVRAAIAFNDLLRYFHLEDKFSPIGNGEKIKWCYLKKNNFGLEKMAYRGYDDPKEIIDFVESYIDKYAIYDAELKTKLQNIYNALGWRYPNKMKFLGNQFFN